MQWRESMHDESGMQVREEDKGRPEVAGQFALAAVVGFAL